MPFYMIHVLTGFAVITSLVLALDAAKSSQFSFFVAELPTLWQSAFDRSVEMRYGSGALGGMASTMVSDNSGFW